MLAALEDASDKPVTLVCASAGYGKTTLLSRWAERTKKSVAWLSLDSSDNEPARFWAYFIAAIKTVVPEFADDSLSPIDEPDTHGRTPFLDALINELSEIDRETAVVLDDFHLIEAEEVSGDLAYLIGHLPPKVHLIFSSRTVPSLGLARLRAQRSLAEFSSADLVFTAAEAADFFSRLGHPELSPEDVEFLYAKTEGWVTGLQLIALWMERRSDSTPFGGVFGPKRPIFEYLFEEVLSQQPEEIQQFLLGTSILDPLNASLCAAILGRPEQEMRDMLELVERNNLFLVALDAKGDWYRYHHLFAAVLRKLLQQKNLKGQQELYSRASRWYERHALFEEAVQMAHQADDIEQIRHLVLINRERLHMQDALPTLLRWTSFLPEEMLRSDPELCLSIALPLGTAGQLERAEAYLDDAERILRGDSADAEALSPETRDLLGQVMGTRSLLASLRGEKERVLEYGQLAMQLLPTDRHYLRGMLLQALAGYETDDLTQWRATLARAVEEQLPLGIPNMVVSARCNLGRVEVKLGLLYDARSVLREAIATYPDEIEHPMLAMAYLEMGALHYEWNELAEAHENLVKGLRLSEHIWISAEVAEAQVLLAQTHLALGDAEEARSGLIGALAAGGGACLTIDFPSNLMRLWLGIDNGRALRATEQGLPELAAQDALRSLTSIYAHQVTARLMREEGRLEEAAEIVRLLLTKVPQGYVRCQIQCLALDAVLSLERGREAEAVSALVRALRLAEPEGFVRTFLDEGASMLKALQLARSHGATSAYVDRLISSFGRVSASRPRPQTAETLTAREVELISLVASGLSTKQIAQRLVISPETVRTHLTNINSKLQVHNRLQAVERARQLGLL